MSEFLGKDYLLTNEKGAYLYGQYAQTQNIYDYHCHLNPKDIAEDRKFDNIGELMLEGDHYKWRIMRVYGIREEIVTGRNTSYKDRFFAFAQALPYFIGNPVYHWVHMELGKYFGINVPLSEKTATEIWDEANAKIRAGGFTARKLISGSNVEFIATTDDPSDNLEWHARIATADDFKTRVVPTWRPDKVLDITDYGFNEYLTKLSCSTNISLETLDDLLNILRMRMDFFADNGCCIADHSLSTVPTVRGSYEEAKSIFSKALSGSVIEEDEAEKFRFFMLYFFGCEYSRRSWAMQLHLSAARNQNTRLFKLLGPDSGLDSCGDPVNIASLRQLFDEIEKECGMPKTIIYTLNPAAYYTVATLAGSFAGGIRGKMQLGAAWWMLDHRDGITEQMKILASTGGLGLHVGMLTDSRSFLSYVRHDYYRRILCSVIGEWVEQGEVPDDPEMLEELIKGICLENARNYFNIKEGR